MNFVNLIRIPALVLAISGSITSQSQNPATQPGESDRGKSFRSQGGLVNFIQGEVQCLCGSEKNTGVRTGQEVANGDIVQTGEDGRAEILLNPGYYFRLFNNTRARLVDLSPGNLKIKLLEGAVIFEVTQTPTPNPQVIANEIVYAPITVLTPRDEYAIVSGGLYRFNLNDGGGSNVNVLKGLVVVAGSKVTSGMIASVLDGKAETGLADKKGMDAFDNWSRERSTNVVQANSSLEKADWFKRLKKDKAYLEAGNQEGTVQANARRTISARKGFVAFVESAAVLNTGESTWQELKAGDGLISGARVQTQAESRIEVHPNPGVYLFMGSNTEMIYSEKEDGQVSVSLVKGSIILISEPDSDVKDRDILTLAADGIEYEVGAKGQYRLNVFEGTSEMLVYDGVVKIAGKTVKAGKKVVRAGGAEAVLPLDRRALDGLVIWSNRRMLLSAVGVVRHFFQLVGGLWLLNQSTGEYTFVPAVWDYKSPYGGAYVVKYGLASDYYPQHYQLPPPPVFPSIIERH